MVSGLIPRRYASALYKYAGKSDSCKAVYETMQRVAEAFRSNPRLEKVLSNPYVEKEDKRKILIAAAGESPAPEYVRFVDLILAHRREDFAYLMALAYLEIYRTKNHISQVRITTAAPLSEEELERLEKVVAAAFENTTFEYETVVNPELIGGFVIDVDSARMDASISNELEQLRQNLIK